MIWNPKSFAIQIWFAVAAITLALLGMTNPAIVLLVFYFCFTIYGVFF